MTYLQTDKMIARKENHIGWLTFNNPARLNAVSLEMWEGLACIAEDFAADPDIRVVVVNGAGDKAFVSGADISEFANQRDSAQATLKYDAISSKGRLALKNMKKPTIAMINGYCVGGGVAVALNCDIRIASENSKFAVPAAKLGLGYEYDGIRKLVDIVGPSFADIGKKYPGQIDYLAAKIKSGGVGIWGPIPMPAQALSEAEAKTIAIWLAAGAGR